MAAEPPRPRLSSVLPPLILGTATFNTQYVADPSRMPYTAIVSRALDLGITGFDTSPYYGPSETLLGDALATLSQPNTYNTTPLARKDYFLITKAGRLASRHFDYTPSWIRSSVLRSLARLRTPHLDLVYTHDVEFVSPAAVLLAVSTLRALRAEGKVRYVGISGFPVPVLLQLAALVLRETGEPLDAVLSYGHCTVQNGALANAETLRGFREAGVGVVLNASILNMGLLTGRGVDRGPQAEWHPSPRGLREACGRVADVCKEVGERLEGVAIRYSLDEWARAGAAAGVGTQFYGGARLEGDDGDGKGSATIGTSVIGVTSVEELEETVREWAGVCVTLRHQEPRKADAESSPGLEGGHREASLRRRQEIKNLVEEKLWPALGSWKDYSWSSPPEGWQNES